MSSIGQIHVDRGTLSLHLASPFLSFWIQIGCRARLDLPFSALQITEGASGGFFGFYVLFSSYVISHFSRYQRGEWCRVRFPFWLFCSHVQPSLWRLSIRTVPLGWAVSPFFALSLLVAGNSWELRGKRAIEGINTKRRGTLFQQRWGWWLNPEDGGVGCADGCLPCYPSAVRFKPRARQATGQLSTAVFRCGEKRNEK